MDSAGAGKQFTFDANGNLTADGTRTFEWDARNQLVAVTEGAQRAEHSYDGIGRRVRICALTGGVETGDTQYVWCNGAICEERTGGAASTRFYSSGVKRSGAAYYHVRDHLTSIREITNASGRTYPSHTDR
jgi:YD repeat-containing protein